jgi:transposase
MQFIGIDVSKKHLHLSWLRDPERGLVRPKAVDNTPAGHAQVLAWAARNAGVAATELCFVLEATGVYHEAVALYLHQAGARVTVANPLHIKRFAESHGIKTKNDRHDGRMLALYGHARRPAPWQPPPPPVRELCALLVRLQALEEDRQREANRLEKAQVGAAPRAVLDSLQEMLATLDAQIAALSQRIDEHLAGSPELQAHRERLLSIPGVGTKLSARFLALFAAKDFRTGKQAAAFLGLVPVETQSGTSVHARPRLAKNGDPRWRARLFLPAMVAAQHNPDVRALYQRLLAAGKCKMSALGAAMRKLVQIAFGVFRHAKPYHAQCA